MSSVEEYAAQPRNHRLSRLALTGDQLRVAVGGSAADSLSRRPEPEAWAPVEIICHLRDTEEWFLTRCRWIVEMQEPRFPRNSPDRWAKERQYLRNDARAALESFRRWRDESLAFFGALTEEAWTRGGVHLDRCAKALHGLVDLAEALQNGAEVIVSICKIRPQRQRLAERSDGGFESSAPSVIRLSSSDSR